VVTSEKYKIKQGWTMPPTNRKPIGSLQKDLAALLKVGYTPNDIIGVVLNRWMKERYPGLTKPFSVLRGDGEPAITAYVDAVLKTDMFTAAFWLSSAYAELKGKTERKWRSLYFTPPYLSDRVLHNAGTALCRGRLIDPACGGAAFLAPAADQMAQKLTQKGCTSREVLAYLEDNVYGCDIDPFLCELSSTFLRMVLSKHIEVAGYEPVFKIQASDGLRTFHDILGTFDTVLCNPPYRKLKRPETIPLQNNYAEIMKGGQPNIYSLFIYRSTQLLKPDGLAVLLTPMSYLSGQYFSQVRKTLLEGGSVCQVDLIHDKLGVFLGAEQDTAITVWQKGVASGKATKIHALSMNGDCKQNGVVILNKSDGPWYMPRHRDDAKLMPLIEQCEFNLTSYGYKPRTGFIVIHRDPRARYSNEKDAAVAKCPIPLIWGANIRPDGSLIFGNNNKNSDRFVDMETKDSSSIVKGPAVALQRVTSPEQRRRLVCAPVPDSFRETYGGVVGENHVCLIERTSPTSVITPTFLAAILRTEVVDRLFRCISGATNVSAYELMHLPLPDPVKVAEYVAAGLPIDEAVLLAFGLVGARKSAGKPRDIPGASSGDKIGRREFLQRR
jgi:hypothetical protein